MTFAEQVLQRRCILVTGKGGVGKTISAIAIAKLAAEKGRRVLVAEVVSNEDVPSRIAEVFGRDIRGQEPVDLAPNLKLALLSPTAGHRRFLEDVLQVRMLASAALKSGAIRRFLSAAPAFGEMGVLYRLLDFARKRRDGGGYEHELLVVDLPATGHALALAQVPEMIVKVIPGGPIGAAVKEGLLLLGDHDKTAAVVVTLLEPLPLTESLDLIAGIRKHRIPFAGIIANRVVRGGFSDEEHEALTRALLSSEPMLGSRLFGHAERTRTLLSTLPARLPHPVVLLDELPERGEALVNAAAKALLTAPWEGASP